MVGLDQWQIVDVVTKPETFIPVTELVVLYEIRVQKACDAALLRRFAGVSRWRSNEIRCE